MKKQLGITFLKLLAGIGLAVLTGILFTAPWLCDGSDVDRIFAVFGK